MTASVQFTTKISVDANTQVIHVDAKDRDDGVILSFASFREQVAVLRELGKIAPVIVPRDSDLEAAGLQSELKLRRNKLTEHEKLARWVARWRAGLAYDPSARDHYEGAAHEAFQRELRRASAMTESALRKVMKDAKTSRQQANVAMEAEVSQVA